jgi:hypothetical protein
MAKPAYLVRYNYISKYQTKQINWKVNLGSFLGSKWSAEHQTFYQLLNNKN